jgi:hypothetical protein
VLGGRHVLAHFTTSALRLCCCRAEAPLGQSSKRHCGWLFGAAILRSRFDTCAVEAPGVSALAPGTESTRRSWARPWVPSRARRPGARATVDRPITPRLRRDARQLETNWQDVPAGGGRRQRGGRRRRRPHGAPAVVTKDVALGERHPRRSIAAARLSCTTTRRRTTAIQSMSTHRPPPYAAGYRGRGRHPSGHLGLVAGPGQPSGCDSCRKAWGIYVPEPPV